MIALNIIRNREMTSDVEKVVNDLFSNTQICPELCYAVIPDSSDAVIDGFKFIQDVYDKRITKHVNIQQVVFDQKSNDDTVKSVTRQVVDAIGGDFQVVTGISELSDGRKISTIITNPVSYVSGRHFYDNNTQYKQFIRDLSGRDVRIVVKDTVFFDNSDLKKAYKSLDSE